MKSELINLEPAQLLLKRHLDHTSPYVVIFKGIPITIFPEVFNPAYTKVSGFLAENIEIEKGQNVLDMFCGSGALGFLVLPEASHLLGVDISEKAISCAKANAESLGFIAKSEFRCGYLWDVISGGEKFDRIIANPPLLPVAPENLLERAIADSPQMTSTTDFLRGCSKHLTKSGKIFMSFSNACSATVGDPMKFIENIAENCGLSLSVKEEWDVGYEVYRILTFQHQGIDL